jgi:hypothetical protein
MNEQHDDAASMRGTIVVNKLAGAPIVRRAA